MGMKVHLQAVESLSQIAPHVRLWASNSACLTQRFPATGCDACVQACPMQVLQLDKQGFSLSGSCEECGRCAAACPSGALALQGFTLNAPVNTETRCIECQQVPESVMQAGAQRVPCLGGLTSSQLLGQLTEEGNQLRLIDHGWCLECPAGGKDTHPASAQVNTARQLLGDMGMDADRICIDYQALPLGKPRKQTPEPVLAHQLNRRGFMRHLVGQAAQLSQAAPIPKTLGEPPETDGRSRIVPTERLRSIAELQRLAGSTAALPPSLFYQVSIDRTRCAQHRICAATCPVTALRFIQDSTTSHQGGGIAFHPQLCIGCGECQRNCPEQAIRLVPEANPVRAIQPRLLSRHTMLSCFDCGREFATAQQDNDEHEPLCPACHKSWQLGQSLFGGLF